ncbi:MAG: hypothetical protein WC475_04970 [Candidatus Paceibacterota bacterium]|jgi:hypothetical protein
MRMKQKPPKAQGKSRKRFYIWLMGFMIIAIMVGSALDLWKKDAATEGSYDYKGLKFANTDAGWVAYKADNTQVWIMTNPAELANMTIPYVNTAMLRTYGKLYVTYDPRERVRVALNQFFKNVPVPQLVVPACTVDIDECRDSPIKNCTDAGNGVGVLMFKEANETMVSFNNDCLVIQGKELTKIVDKMILESL